VFGDDEGVWVIDLSNDSCGRFETPSEFSAPDGMAVAWSAGRATLYVGGLCEGELCVISAEWGPTAGLGVTWDEILNVRAASSALPAEWLAATSFMRIDAIAVNPAKNNQVVVTTNAGIFFDHYAPQFIFTSLDGGETFSADEEFAEGLPVRKLFTFGFSGDGQRVFAGGSCSSLFIRDWPY
ncbi:MAG: hypothetical protein KC561_16130, partial [Myxococcales bacterium]|nr:hypothetical protein [Myxococcales bacterium]